MLRFKVYNGVREHYNLVKVQMWNYTTMRGCNLNVESAFICKHSAYFGVNSCFNSKLKQKQSSSSS